MERAGLRLLFIFLLLAASNFGYQAVFGHEWYVAFERTYFQGCAIALVWAIGKRSDAAMSIDVWAWIGAFAWVTSALGLLALLVSNVTCTPVLPQLSFLVLPGCT